MRRANRTPKLSLPELRRRLRSELPRLLREDRALRRELQDVFQDVFLTRSDIAELRALREDFNRFAEEALRRFEALDRRFEAIIGELRTQRLHLSRLSGRLGHGLEYLVRGVVEEFAGKSLTRSARLVLKDTEGEVFGVPADIEFDLLASDGEVYLCEVKSHIEPDDVLRFHRKALFAAKHIERPFTRVMIGASMEATAEQLMGSLGIQSIVRARIAPDDSAVLL
ncbi:MAG: hypothetical protein ACE5JD_15675 [Candidatus Methylomirabilia bacterium]